MFFSHFSLACIRWQLPIFAFCNTFHSWVLSCDGKNWPFWLSKVQRNPSWWTSYDWSIIIIGILVSIHCYLIANTIPRSRTPFCFADRWRTLSFLPCLLLSVARSNLLERRRWYHKHCSLKILCSKCWEGRYRRLVETWHGNLLQFPAVVLRVDWCPWVIWPDCPLIDHCVLAFEHDDVFVILVNLPVCVRSP